MDLFSKAEPARPTPLNATRLRRWRLLFVLLAFAALRSPACADDAYAAAAAKLEAGEHAAARDAFAAIVSDGAYAPEVFFGLGNSHYRLGDVGAAALAYRRALFLDLSYKEARMNLGFLADKTGFIDSATPDAPGYLRQFSGGTIRNGIVAGILVAALSAALLIGLRRRPRWLAPAAIAALVLGASSATAFAYIAQKRDASLPPADSAVVIAPATVARTAPADSSSEIISLPPGSLVRVEAIRGKWTYIDLPGDLRGWVRSALLETLWPFDAVSVD